MTSPQSSSPTVYLDLPGHTPMMGLLVRWVRYNRRALPRYVQPVFRVLAYVLLSAWFAYEELRLWAESLGWPRELRVLTFAVWTLIVLIVGLMLFDLLLTYNSAGMVR